MIINYPMLSQNEEVHYPEKGKSQQNTPQLNQAQVSQAQSSEEEECIDFDPDSPNQKFFSPAQIKPFDFKAKWLGNTNQLIAKYDTKLSELKKEKNIMKEHFRQFDDNQNRFKISSLRKINFDYDRKEIYRQFMQRSRRLIQKLHPSLLINIFSYIESNVFLALARMRRVSQIYNFIYHNATVITFFSERDFGSENVSLEVQENWCRRFVDFRSTFLYYKEIKYTILIPQNSIKSDLEKAVDFINEVYKRVFQIKKVGIGYFQLMNRFMQQHRVALALEALTFTDMAVVRKASIVAFSNYLAFNPASRKKEEITKTKYLKMIHLVEDEDYRDSLVINSKISNFLQEQYGYEFAVLIDTLKNGPVDMGEEPFFNIAVYHYYNELKSFFMRGVPLQNKRITVNDVELEFDSEMSRCSLYYSAGGREETETIVRQYMPTVERGEFGHCYIYRGQFYYVLIIRPIYEMEGNQF